MTKIRKAITLLTIWFGFWIVLAIVLPSNLKSMVVIGGMFGAVFVVMALLMVVDEEDKS